MTIEIISADLLIPYQINQDNQLEPATLVVDDLKKSFPPSQLRRLTRIDKLFLKSVYRLLAPHRNVVSDLSQLNYLITTSYGELQGNLKYMKLLNSDTVSPTTFIQTISNSIMGNVAMLMEFRGNCVAFSCSNVIGMAIASMTDDEVYIVSGGDEKQVEIKNFAHVNEGTSSLLLRKTSKPSPDAIRIDWNQSISNPKQKINRLDKLFTEMVSSRLLLILLNDKVIKSYVFEKCQQKGITPLDLSEFVGTYYGGNSIIATSLAYKLLTNNWQMDGVTFSSTLILITNEKSGPLIMTQLSKGASLNEEK
jgi:hypothetical protein